MGTPEHCAGPTSVSNPQVVNAVTHTPEQKVTLRGPSPYGGSYTSTANDPTVARLIDSGWTVTRTWEARQRPVEAPIRPPCVACGGDLGPDNIDRVCGTCVLKGDGLAIALELARDIIGTARQYPEIVRAASFGDLHDIYDANESVLAAIDAAGYGGIPFEQWLMDRINYATDLVDAAMREGGFVALADLIMEGEI